MSRRGLVGTQKRHRGANVRTLTDLGSSHRHNGGVEFRSIGRKDGTANLEKNDGGQCPMTTFHIPDLPSSDAAAALLDRIRSEFLPLAQRRGWNVLTLSEMCCCGDGLDHAPTSNGRRRRRRKVAPANVWGYNMSSFGRSGSGSGGRTSRIHLRLRDPRNHSRILPYTDVAGTMSHELAHCEIGPHSVRFYRLMDDIQKQHAEYLARGMVVDGDGFPMGSTEARRLGGGGGGGGNGHNVWERVASAAMERAARSRLTRGGPRRLGGGGIGGSGNGSSSAGSRGPKSNAAVAPIDPNLPPREAARRAAEFRAEEEAARREAEDAPWCLPCNEVISLIGDDDDDDKEEEEEEDGEPDGSGRICGRGNGRKESLNGKIEGAHAEDDIQVDPSNGISNAERLSKRQRRDTTALPSDPLSKSVRGNGIMSNSLVLGNGRCKSNPCMKNANRNRSDVFVRTDAVGVHGSCGCRLAKKMVDGYGICSLASLALHGIGCDKHHEPKVEPGRGVNVDDEESSSASGTVVDLTSPGPGLGLLPLPLPPLKQQSIAIPSRNTHETTDADVIIIENDSNPDGDTSPSSARPNDAKGGNEHIEGGEKKHKRSPGLSVAHPLWSCAACTYLNVPLTWTCGACGTVKTVPVGSALCRTVQIGAGAQSDMRKKGEEEEEETRGEWPCKRCTLRNAPSSVQCNACGLVRPCTRTCAVTTNISRSEAIERCRNEEVRRSEVEYGGFNIYCKVKAGTGTMNHLT